MWKEERKEVEGRGKEKRGQIRKRGISPAVSKPSENLQTIIMQGKGIPSFEETRWEVKKTKVAEVQRTEIQEVRIPEVSSEPSI